MTQKFFQITIFMCIMFTRIQAKAVGYNSLLCEKQEQDRNSAKELLIKCISQNLSASIEKISEECKAAVLSEIQSVKDLLTCQKESNPLKRSNKN